MTTPSSRLLCVASWLSLALTGARAQAAGDLLPVNSEWERYWRVLQVSGAVPEYPWSSRMFGPADLRRLQAVDSHPWRTRPRTTALRVFGLDMAALPLQVRTIVNSAVPFGFNEGPVWAGRGVTAVLETGVAVRAGVLSAALAPVMFQAQNAAFELMPNGHTGHLAFGNPFPWPIDMPQRFGAGPYRRLDPGHSFVRLDAKALAVGVSTAAQHWGPSRDHPLVLGSNAGGFPHAFVGTASAVRLGPALVQAKAVWGRLSHSAYTPMETVARYRLGAGAVLVVSPVPLPGLELGVSRFVHVLWLGEMLTAANLLRPFGRLVNTSDDNVENQVASLFGRWLVQEAGIEVYGEYAREDGNLSFRHLLLEPDHAAGYTLGLQRVWARDGDRRHVARAEVANTRSTTPHLIPGQNPFYVHSPISQGHTHRGLALGSAAGFGGGGTSIAYDRYSPDGRWTVGWTRLMRAEYLTAERAWVPVPDSADVFHALGVDGLLFRGRTAVTFELTGVYEVNRDFRRNVFNLRAGAGVQYLW